MKTFTSYDGTDGNGVRAEVHVSTGEGVVKEIKENANGTADVHFTVDNLKFPVHGWIGIDNPVYQVVLKAQESGQAVSFRIEAQRKSKVDRTIPITELRSDMKKAKDNTISILASIDGIVSDEAVTNPSEDPNPTFGRIKATGNEPKKSVAGGSLDASYTVKVLAETAADQTVTSDIIAVLAGQALLAGAEVADVLAAISGPDRKDDSKPELRKAFSVEAPSWKAYNSDGRANLGTSGVQAAVGSEQFTRGHLTKLVDSDTALLPEFNDAVVYFARMTLAISDKIQSAAYGDGFRADRSVASHARVRGVVYDTINEYFPLPIDAKLAIDPEVVAAWVTNVGKLSYTRFKNALLISNDVAKIDEIEIPESLVSNTGAKPAKAEKPAEEAVVVPVVEVETVVTEAVAPVVEEAPAKVEEPVELAVTSEVTPVVEETVEETVVEEAEESSADSEVAEEVVGEQEFVFLPQMPLDEGILVGDKLPTEIASTEETIDMFKEFVGEAGLSKAELAKVSKLLAWTYGPKFTKAQNIPDETLTEFIDFYVASGPENFVKTINGLIQ